MGCKRGVLLWNLLKAKKADVRHPEAFLPNVSLWKPIPQRKAPVWLQYQICMRPSLGSTTLVRTMDLPEPKIPTSPKAYRDDIFKNSKTSNIFKIKRLIILSQLLSHDNIIKTYISITSSNSQSKLLPTWWTWNIK